MKMICLLSALSISALVGATAFAGATQPAQVTVTVNSDGSGSASGDMVTARFAPDTVTLIGCGLRHHLNPDGTVNRFGFCQATNSANVQGQCSVTNPDLLDALKATSDFAFIVFNWDASGTCTFVGFSTQSFYIPEHLAPKK
jgi:hypothetical protein